MLKYVVFSVCIVRRRAIGVRVWKVGVLRHVCAHPVAVLNTVFCMTCIVNAGRG